jgi:predicted AAA+ superfamily ATPase
MLRNALKQLDIWLSSPRRRPLIIRGARQVGKSTLVRMFAEEHDLDLLEVNLEQHAYLQPLFASLDSGKILDELSILAGKPCGPNTLLFLDEIQTIPVALAALRYFFEQRPELPVICAGSLLELVLPTIDVSMPVGRIEYFHLGPLTFSEFAAAVGDDLVHQKLASYRLGAEWSDALHRRAIKLYDLFVKVGGMPEAVATYIQAPEHAMGWRQAQQRIIDTYGADFAKYRSRGQWVPVLQQVYRRLPSTIGHKVKYSELAPDTRIEKTRQAVQMLIDARIILRASHTAPPAPPLAANASHKVYKLYWNDIGLLGRIVGGPMDAAISAEQFVAQHLAYVSAPYEEPALFYWLREGRADNAEIDFLLQRADETGIQIVPVEVKSGSSKRMRSLQLYCETYQPTLAIRFYDGPPVREMWGATELVSLPIYMAPYCNQLTNSAV